MREDRHSPDLEIFLISEGFSRKFSKSQKIGGREGLLSKIETIHTVYFMCECN